MTRPIILVSNDDGWMSAGLVALADALEALGEVWVVAPERERSAVSHQISLHKPLRLESWGPRRFWCSGSPADCVYIALHHVLPAPPALVVSGINRGANLGQDVVYSGTVAAAREAALSGIPAIASSRLGSASSAESFAAAAHVTLDVARNALAEGIPDGAFLNVNTPADLTEVPPVRLAHLGERNYERAVSELHDPRGRPYYWIGGGELGFHASPGSDCDGVAAGVATVTPVTLALTDDAAFRAMRAKGWETVGTP